MKVDSWPRAWIWALLPRLFWMWTCFLPIPSWAESQVPTPAYTPNPTVKVEISDEIVAVSVTLAVEASRQEVWEVLTDYDNATSFIPGLISSEVISRSGPIMVVWQIGKLGIGPFSVRVEAVRELQLQPYESIRTRLIKGNMKSSEGITRLIAEGSGGTRIEYENKAEPDFWIPPIIGRAVIAGEIREQFLNFRAEILRRKKAKTPSPKSPFQK